MNQSIAEVIGWTGEERLPDFLKYHYGIELRRAEVVRGILKLETDQGCYALKRVREGEKDRWRMVEELSQYFKEQGSKTQIPKPILTGSTQPFFNGYRYSYVLYPWIPATALSLEHPEDWRKASQALAQFHQDSIGFSPTKKYRRLNRAGTWQYEWAHKKQQLDVFKLAARWTSTPTEADQTWLNISSYSTGLMENLLEYYQKIDGDTLCKESLQHGKVCHGNLHRHNLILSSDHQVHLVDWNEAILDVRSRDVANWLLYAYGRTGSNEVLATILREYQEIDRLDEGEYALIYARLLFPGKLTNVLERVYETQTVALEVAVTPIQTANEVEDHKLELLRRYATIVKEEFRVTVPQLSWV